VIKEINFESNIPEKTIKQVLDMFFENVVQHCFDKNNVMTPIGKFELGEWNKQSYKTYRIKFNSKDKINKLITSKIAIKVK
jgi:hypothetical protein